MLSMKVGRDVLSVEPLMVTAGKRIDVKVKVYDPTRPVAFDCNPLGEHALVLDLRVGPHRVLDERFAAGRYRISDFKRMLPDLKLPTVPVCAEIILTLQFDWPGGDRCEPQEFRCWWIVDVMRMR